MKEEYMEKQKEKSADGALHTGDAGECAPGSERAAEKTGAAAAETEKETAAAQTAALPAEACAAEADTAEEAVQKGKRGIFGIKIFNYRLVPLFLMCIIMSFVGFVVENLFRLFRGGVINSRRQFLPFLFAYGIAIFALYVLVGTPREMRFFKWKLFKKDSKLSSAAKYTLYWLILFAGVFFGEVLFGTFVEAVSGVVLWDYTGIPLRFTKYTSIPTALGLSVGVMLLMRFVFEPLMRLLERIPDKVALGIDIGLGIPIVLDWLVMLVLMLGFGISKNWWAIQIW